MVFVASLQAVGEAGCEGGEGPTADFVCHLQVEVDEAQLAVEVL